MDLPNPEVGENTNTMTQHNHHNHQNDDMLSEIRYLEQRLQQQLEKTRQEVKNDEAIDENEASTNDDSSSSEIHGLHYHDEDFALGELHGLENFEESINRELGEFSDLLDGSPVRRTKKTTHHNKNNNNVVKRLDEQVQAPQLIVDDSDDDDRTLFSRETSGLETVTDLHEIWIAPSEGGGVRQKSTGTASTADTTEVGADVSTALQDALRSQTKRVMGILQSFATQLESSDDLESVKSNVHASILSEVKNLANIEASLAADSSKTKWTMPRPESEELLEGSVDHENPLFVSSISPIRPTSKNNNIDENNSMPISMSRPRSDPRISDISVSDETTVSAMTTSSQVPATTTTMDIYNRSRLTSYEEFETSNRTMQRSNIQNNNTINESSFLEQTSYNDPYFDPSWQPGYESNGHHRHRRHFAENNDNKCSGGSECCVLPLQSLLGVVRKMETAFQYFVETKRGPMLSSPQEDDSYQETELAEFVRYDRSSTMITTTL